MTILIATGFYGNTIIAGTEKAVSDQNVFAGIRVAAIGIWTS